MKNENYSLKSLGLTHLCSTGAMLAQGISVLLFLLFFVTLPAWSGGRNKPLMIQQQGSFAVGGTVINSPGIFNQW